MTAQMVILLTQLDDGSLSSRRWDVSPEQVAGLGLDDQLGPPGHVAYTPADAVARLAPQAATAAVVVSGGPS